MPRFDGVGPLGFGPGTGWGLGPCGGGRFRGRGFGRRFLDYDPYYGSYPTRVTKKQETEMLADEAKALEEELQAIKERLDEIKGQK